MKPLVRKTYIFTPEARPHIHEILCDVANYMTSYNEGLCEGFEECTVQYITSKFHAPSCNDLSPEEKQFEESVEDLVNWFRPPEMGDNEVGYFWLDPNDADMSDIEELEQVLEDHNARLLAVGFLIAMNETGDL